jgi:signal transduction histidine kinase
VIRTTAELALRRERPAEAYREALQEVAAESEKMTTLIEDLLSLARNGTAAGEMPREPVEVRTVIHEVCAKMRGLAELRDVRITADADAGMISGNRPALDRLFLVLLDNAIKYSRPGGEVIVAAHEAAGEMVVTVEDFGEGISAADLPHIFKRFYRADRSRSSAGHGLGLALAESIARAHGARIEVDSSEGAGSRFRVMFAARNLSVSENLQVARVH